MKSKSNHGGSRLGAGKPKGYKHQKTLEREAARAYLSERVRAEIDPLTTAHLEAAKGVSYMFGKVNDTWTRITDPETMLRCLQSGESFYRVTATDPDTKALKDIFDREFGRPTEHMHLGGEDGGPVLVKFVDAGA